jgi:hypothetical protein
MAKKKATRPSKAADRKPIAVTIKSGPEWKAWIDGLADYCRLDVAKVIDLAVVEYAQRHGYEPSAPRR